MGFFGFGNKNNKENVQPVAVSNKIDLTKRIPDTKAGIELKKSVVCLDKSLVDLSKKSGIAFDNHRARVAVVMDYSGSMSSLYRTGEVQKVLNRLMPLALRFDDNGELDVWIFDNSYERIESMTINNFEHFVQNEILRLGRSMGGTSYSPVLRDVIKKYCEEDKNSPYPAFIIFITDGANGDKRDTDIVIRKTSQENIFVQFVGMGSAHFDYLEKLDDLAGRPVDNTGFIKVNDFARLSDEKLYKLLLSQYPDWLRAKGLR